MIDDSRQQSKDDKIRSLVKDFLQIDMGLNAILPKEIEQVHNLLDGMRIENKPQHFINYTLFSRIIYNLYRESTMTMSELSHNLSVPFSTATRMVDWVVDNGYVQRLPDPEDRRVVRVTLTDNGRDLYQAIEGYMAQRFEQMLSPLTVEEQGVLLMLLEKVARSLREAEIQI